MKNINDIRSGRHCVFVMHVHLVFVTKYRRRVFDKAAIDRLKELFTKICGDFEAELKEMDGEADHVHLLVIHLELHDMDNPVQEIGLTSGQLGRSCEESCHLVIPLL